MEIKCKKSASLLWHFWSLKWHFLFMFENAVNFELVIFDVCVSLGFWTPSWHIAVWGLKPQANTFRFHQNPILALLVARCMLRVQGVNWAELLRAGPVWTRGMSFRCIRVYLRRELGWIADQWQKIPEPRRAIGLCFGFLFLFVLFCFCFCVCVACACAMDSFACTVSWLTYTCRAWTMMQTASWDFGFLQVEISGTQWIIM